jgi:hypothetical protein
VVFVASLAFGYQISVCRDMGGSVAYTQWKDLGHVAYLCNVAPTDTHRCLLGDEILDRIEAILSSREHQG